MDASVLSLVKDYGGLLIGLVFLFAAVSVIPGRAKWYVLTAGLAILGYEAYLRTRNRKLMAEADEERKGLRIRADELSRRSAELENTVTKLNQQLAENKAKLLALNKETDELALHGEDILQRKAQLDEESLRRSEENETLLKTMGNHEELLTVLRDAQHALEKMDRPAP